MIEPERLQHIPPEYRQQHSFCFWLHDRIADAMIQAEAARVADVHFKFSSEDEKKAFVAAGDPITYFLDNGRKDLAKRIALNQTVIPLYADALHFIFEGLSALEKHKFTVSLALFRKPFRQNLMFLTWMFADEDDFFARMQTDPASLDEDVTPERKRELLAKAIAKLSSPGFFADDVIYGMVFDKKKPQGLGHYFDKALHLVTRQTAIRTENLNINMIFKKPSDNDLYEGIYEVLAYVLMYLLFLEIEMIGRMSKVPEYYVNWLATATTALYEVMFSDRKIMIDHLNELWEELLVCTLCRKPLKIITEGALEFFAADLIRCQHCKLVQQFPLYWLMSKIAITGQPSSSGTTSAGRA